MPTKQSIPQWTSRIISFDKIVCLLTMWIDCMKRVWNEFAILLFVYCALFSTVLSIFTIQFVYATLTSLYLALDCVTLER
ncbi:hypothetical protein QQG55_14810 [Brugia pahangi]